ncbi:MAG: molybdate ABC transporter substrate-binding protein [Oscillospiraceae bacterium]|nr:molybdate ABC transporter substrate-binding protein [Oscillospiraceae bacterium]
MKKLLALMLSLMMVMSLASCGSSSSGSTEESTSAETSAAVEESEAAETEEAEAEETTEAEAETETAEAEESDDLLAETTVYLYAAASMENAFQEIIALYAEYQPNVTIVGSYDSSGTLLTQIEEANGMGIDIFFSAGKKQVTTLDETVGLAVEGTVVDLLSNALCLVTYNGSETAVTGWEDMDQATSMALCDGTVPVGKYTRELLVSLGLLEDTDDNSAYTTDDVSAALGGLEINECANVSAAAAAVVEQSNEIATIYYTDYYAYQDDLTILAIDEDGELTGAITYPVCQVANSEADEAELAATEDFLAFIQSEGVLQIFEDYCFIVNS